MDLIFLQKTGAWTVNRQKLKKDLIFRCKDCEFQMSDGRCSVKVFANNHKCDYPLEDFGSMGMH